MAVGRVVIANPDRRRVGGVIGRHPYVAVATAIARGAGFARQRNIELRQAFAGAAADDALQHAGEHIGVGLTHDTGPLGRVFIEHIAIRIRNTADHRRRTVNAAARKRRVRPGNRIG